MCEQKKIIATDRYYVPAFTEFNDRVWNGGIKDVRVTDFYHYVKDRKKWGKDPCRRVEKWAKDSLDIKENGLRVPIAVRESDLKVIDGLHRLFVVAQLGKQRILAVRP